MDIQVNVLPSLLNVGLQLLATLILFLFIKKFFWPVLEKFLKERQDFVEEEINSAKLQNMEAQVNLESSKTSIDRARVEALDIVNDSKQAATSVYDQIIADAKRDASYIKKNAKDQIQLEEEKFYSDLKDKVADLAVDAAGKIITKELDRKNHSEIIDAVIAGDE